MTTALLIVDVQQGLCEGEHAAFESADVIARINRVSAKARAAGIPLQAHAVTDLIICGMHTEFCVGTTTRRALALGYPVILVADAHTSEGNEHVTPRQVIEHHNATLTNISSFGPRVRAVLTGALQIGA